MSAPVDHPGPELCPRCYVSDVPVSFALCAPCSEASAVWPSPWSMLDGALRDANGTALVSGNDGRVDGHGEPIIGPLFRNVDVLRLIRAAPDLADALRRIRAAAINPGNPLATVYLLRAIAEKALAALDAKAGG